MAIKIMNPPQNPSELDKAIEEALRDIAPFQSGDGYYGKATIRASCLSSLIDAAKRLKEAEKENHNLNLLIEKFQASALLGVDSDGITPEMVEQEIVTLRTEYKNALEALKNNKLNEHVVNCPNCIQALYFNLSNYASSGKLKLNLCDEHLRLVAECINSKQAVLSTPHAIAAMKKGEV